MKSIAVNAIGFSGLGCIVYGLSLWSLPAAIVTGGAFLVLIGLVGAMDRPKLQ